MYPNNDINNNGGNQNNFSMQGNVINNQQSEHNQINQTNSLNTNFNQNQTENTNYHNSYQQVNGNLPIKPPKKRKLGLIIGITTASVAVVATVIGVRLLTDNKSPQDYEEEEQIIENNPVKDYTSIGSLKENLNLDYTDEGSFMMVVSDVYTWSGHGTMVVGNILRGTIRAGEKIQILGLNDEIKETTVNRVEIDRNEIEYGKIGDTVSLLLEDYHRSEIFMGQVVIEPNSMIASTKFEAEISVFEDLEITDDYYYFDFVSGSKKVNMKFDNDIQKLSSNQKINSTIYVEDIQPLEVGLEVEIKQNDVLIGTAKIIKIFN